MVRDRDAVRNRQLRILTGKRTPYLITVEPARFGDLDAVDRDLAAGGSILDSFRQRRMEEPEIGEVGWTKSGSRSAKRPS